MTPTALTIKEMEVLCIFHDGTLSSTLDLLRHAEEAGTAPPNRATDISSLIAKLATVEAGGVVSLAFDAEK